MKLILTSAERHALRRALKLLELDRWRVLASIGTGALGLASSLALSGVAAWLIARAAQMPDVVALGVAPVMVRLFGISRSVLRYCERLLSHDTALRGMNALRTHLYEILSTSRTDTVVGLRRGEVLARVGSDVDAIGDLVVRAFLPIGVALTVGIFTCLAMGIVYWPAGIVLACCLLLAGLVGPLATIRSARTSELARQKQTTDLSATVLTAIDGGSELNVTGRMHHLLAHLGKEEKELAHIRDRAARPAALAASIDTFAMGLAVLGCIAVGAPAVNQGQLAPVWLAVIALLPLSAFEATANLGSACLQLVTSAGAAVRIFQLIELAEATPANTTGLSLPASADAPCQLRARNLAVGWPGGPIVAENINLELSPGKHLAIVGPSGIGKTTLLLTLAGLLPARAGELTLDGVPLDDISRAAVTARLTLTAEDAHIFNTSVLENLRVARGDLTPAQATAVLGQAGLGAWLENTPTGLDTLVGADAKALSGGERRRLLLARALSTPAPLMLLDEPGEHLDASTADALVHDLLSADPSRGVLLVTHRLSALSAADEVIVMGAGKAGQSASIHARATHAELARTNTAYQWALAQENHNHE